MGKTPVRMKAVVYALSPFQQKVMPGLWKDITTKIHHKVTENWISATLLLGPVVGTYQLHTHLICEMLITDPYKILISLNLMPILKPQLGEAVVSRPHGVLARGPRAHTPERVHVLAFPVPEQLLADVPVLAAGEEGQEGLRRSRGAWSGAFVVTALFRYAYRTT
nr:unnamed protein product [Digitaria exilis]